MTLISDRFGDIYFSPADGLAETFYVFLDGNALQERFPYASAFTIAETGFGTGLNFLAAAVLWEELLPKGGQLHFVSVEKYPLLPEQIDAAIHWPELDRWKQRLLSALPPPVPGWHRRAWPEAGVALSLYTGDVLDFMRELNDRSIDAWFLDGFAPSRNPEMWAPQILSGLGRTLLPGGTAASFTAAGEVRRGLEAAGLQVERRKGFGNKRHMTVAHKAPPSAGEGAGGSKNPQPVRKPVALPLPQSSSCREEEVIVIGGGIAGCSAAHALSQRGYRVTLLEAGKNIAAGASGNPHALLHPPLGMGWHARSLLYYTGYAYTLHLIQRLNGEAAGWFTPLPLIDAPVDDDNRDWMQRAVAKLALPEDWLALKEDGAWLPRAGLVDMADFCRALLPESAGVVTECRVENISHVSGSWVAKTSRGRFRAKSLVLAAGYDSARLTDALSFSEEQPGVGNPSACAIAGSLSPLPLGQMHGQIAYVKDAAAVDHIRCGKGHIAPLGKGHLVAGATYDHGLTEPILNEEGLARNAATYAKLTGHTPPSITPAWAGIRTTTPDRLPCIGTMPDKVEGASPASPMNMPVLDSCFVSTGHGSRGLLSAPLAGEAIASSLAGEPPVLSAELRQALAPARFLWRDMRRR